MDFREDDSTDPRWVLALIMGLAVTGGIIDLILDRPQSITFHVVFELALIVFGVFSSLYLVRGWLGARASLVEARRTAAERQVERDAWRARAEHTLRGLGEEVSRQFDGWGLSPAERDTALMLLKGFSLKHIAALTGRSERTVRQHAVAVYEKSGLAGRAELSGFFLGDLLLPAPSPRA
ncbi:MAG TPA: helix-turn-helix transcriptional regulator [Gemmatimonadales bacterium]|nr:helix-turn-helix transcriptional regulator [Gemmatimonadales bacterium]